MAGDPFAVDNPSTSYGSGGVASTEVAQRYFYTGPNQTGANGGGGLPITKLTDDLFTGTDFTAAGTAGHVAKTTAGTTSSLASYIQSIYDANPTGGGYLVLRLTPDALTDTNLGTMRYQFPYAPDTDPGAGTGPTYDAYGAITNPQINVTFVPEPTGLAVGGIAAIGLLARRRRYGR